jgi:hypothetical protein
MLGKVILKEQRMLLLLQKLLRKLLVVLYLQLLAQEVVAILEVNLQEEGVEVLNRNQNMLKRSLLLKKLVIILYKIN